MAELQEMMPPGWECKLDAKSGRHYYINHYTKTTTWDDPRNRHIGLFGTPKHISNVTTEHIPLQELRSTSRMSPLTVRGARVQDSSLTVQSDTDEAVAKISAMFPTVSESHIRLLMKNCRYMKSIFPQAEETVILDILYNNDSNIQKTSEKLKEMGFERRDTVKMAQQKVEAARRETEAAEEVRREEERPRPPPRLKTAEEKAAVKEKLKGKYSDVAEHLITIALESVDYNESKASQIIDIMVQENTATEAERSAPTVVAETEQVETATEVPQSSILPVSQSRQSIKSLLKSEKIEKDKTTSYSRNVDDIGDGYRSSRIIDTKGPNPGLIQGPNDKLLLVDYVDWQGPEPTFRKGPQGLAKGPDRSLLTCRTYKARGANADLCKGPKFGLAKGSIFSQLKNGIVGESRGK